MDGGGFGDLIILVWDRICDCTGKRGAIGGASYIDPMICSYIKE